MPRYPIHSPSLASRRVGSEGVIISPKAGKVWALNEAGALLWEMADGSFELQEMAGRIEAARGLAQGGVLDEVGQFFEDLAARNLVFWREVPGVGGARARRAAESVPAALAEPPAVISEEPLNVLAGACNSGHTGQAPLCMAFGSCVTGWS
jgi:hypothetical protein